MKVLKKLLGLDRQPLLQDQQNQPVTSYSRLEHKESKETPKTTQKIHNALLHPAVVTKVYTDYMLKTGKEIFANPKETPTPPIKKAKEAASAVLAGLGAPLPIRSMFDKSREFAETPSNKTTAPSNGIN